MNLLDLWQDYVKTTDAFIADAKRIHGDRFIYEDTIYEGAKRKLWIECRTHGKFFQNASSHLSGVGCPSCANGKKKTSRLSDTATFIEKALKKHGETYLYTDCKYVSAHKPLTIECRVHGPFAQSPNAHLNGQGCAHCGRSRSKQTKRMDKSLFLELCEQAHGDKYSYKLPERVGRSDKITIICTAHGEFSKTAGHHVYRRHGCPTCHAESRLIPQHQREEPSGGFLGQNLFLDRSKERHGERYEYSTSCYKGGKNEVEIICKHHGPFLQRADHHMAGRGCPSCIHRISSKETAFLDLIGVEKRQHRLYINGKRYEVDGYDHESNTIYEFYGDYWHGNPEKYDASDINPNVRASFGILYEKTMLRQAELKLAGFTIVSIWESELDAFMKEWEEDMIKLAK